MKKITLLSIIILVTCSCSGFKEVHYFKDNLKPTANYYKVKVRGYALLSSSRYVSGYYDKGAVQAYFGEITQPNNGKFIPLLADDPKKTNEKELVLLLSTNSDAIANSIGNLVKSKTVMNSLTLIANKDKLEEANIVKSKISSLSTDIQLLIAETDAYLDIDTSIASFNNVTAKERLKQFVKLKLMELSKDATPNTFDELYKWYLNNNQN